MTSSSINKIRIFQLCNHCGWSSTPPISAVCIAFVAVYQQRRGGAGTHARAQRSGDVSAVDRPALAIVIALYPQVAQAANT
jgi:hypothetical protein